MVAYSFKKRFIVPIRANTKRQTIRAERRGRSRHARPGEPVQLYFGMRTKHVRLIAAPLCEAVYPISIHLGDRIVCANDGWIREEADLDAFAVCDGFRDFDDLTAFWRREHPGVLAFSGVLIRWAPIAAFAPADETRRGGADRYVS